MKKLDFSEFEVLTTKDEALFSVKGGYYVATGWFNENGNHNFCGYKWIDPPPSGN